MALSGVPDSGQRERQESAGLKAAAAAPAASLRIAGVDPERGFGGGETQVLGLTLALRGAGHSAELIADPAGVLWARAQEVGVTCHSRRIRNSVDVGAGLRLRTLLQRGRYDIVHFHTARAHALAPYARGCAGALIVTRRMDYVPNRWFAPWLYNRAVDGVVAISEGVADALARAGVVRDRVAIIPSGVDCAHFVPAEAAARARARAELCLGADDVAVGMVGALVARKGHRFLLEAMALARGASEPRTGASRPGPRLHCLIAGAGPDRPMLEARIGEIGLADRVRIIGPLADPRRLLWALDIFVMPSLKEGLGVAALEAMACGLPVVGCATGGLREAVDDEHTGLLVAPGDAGSLAQALTRLAEVPELRVAMGAAARERVRARFEINAMASRTLALYRECLDNAHGGKRKG
jgi:glycosyltransferase involved in cell wall biosynthesis